MDLRYLLIGALALPSSAFGLPQKAERAVVLAARAHLGVPYVLGGRRRNANDGLDCQGVIFFALEKVFGCGWRSFSVYPTRSVQRKELGAPVPGLSPVATEKLDVRALRPGDVVMMVGRDENPAEGSIGTLVGAKGERTPVWVWHTGIYTGEGKWIVGDHYAGEVVEVPLMPYLRAHADAYQGVFVTRIGKRPRPQRCRRVQKKR